MYTFVSNSENETMAFAYKLASYLQPCDIVVLSR